MRGVATRGIHRADDPGDAAEFGALLAERGTSKAQWVEDLFAQYGERIAWTYP